LDIVEFALFREVVIAVVQGSFKLLNGSHILNFRNDKMDENHIGIGFHPFFISIYLGKY